MMSGSKPAPALVFFLFILTIITSFKSSHSNGNYNRISCPQMEKEAFLGFKESVKDPSNQLSSWNDQVDCCKWEYVVCDNMTGHVHELRLGFDKDFALQGKLNPSLLNLTHLKYLDLSWNDFDGNIPSFIGSFIQLEYLDLLEAGFLGNIPHTIGNLSSLGTLKLSSKENNQLLRADSLEFLYGLSHLQHLEFDNVNLSSAANWVQVINSLPHLVELHFRECSLNNFTIGPYNTSTSLTILDLSYNFLFSSLVPMRWIFQLNKLIRLDLSANYLEGPLPRTANLTARLQHIDLSVNHFNSTVPDWLYSCRHLESLFLSYNSLQGIISNAIGNLSSLKVVDLSNNYLSGRIPRRLERVCSLNMLVLSYNELEGDILSISGSNCFRKLQYLGLSANALSGPIPGSLGRLSSLEQLYLDHNKFTGNLPESLGQLFNLRELFIHVNVLEGVVSEMHFSNLTKLSSFFASGNHLTLRVNKNWTPSFRLAELDMGSWNIGAEGTLCPTWLDTQKDYLKFLNLSRTGISFQAPNWFWKIPILDLSHNKLYGTIPDMRDAEVRYVYLSSNQFNGSLPRVSNVVQELDLSNNSFSGGLHHFLCNITTPNPMSFLHLGGNKLSGELSDCWTKLSSLRVLNLGNNNFSGNIPHSIGVLASLRSLSLHNNSLSGMVPSSMQNCTSLIKIDLAQNKFIGNIPSWMGISLVNVKILILRSNKLSGKISPSICRLRSLHILDLSENNFSGMIPICISNFTAMATETSDELSSFYYFGDFVRGPFQESASIVTKGNEWWYDTILHLVKAIDLSRNSFSGEIPEQLFNLVELRSLNLSWNHLTGRIPDGVGGMKQLESLDLSRNYLSGKIPNSFSVLSSLNQLILSYNNLTGKIPVSTQLQSLPSSSFIGNELCGPPLTSNCKGNDGISIAGREYHTENDNGGVDSRVDWFYIFLSLGYAVGFSAVCGTLLLKRSWRDAYFGFLQNLWDKFYVFVKIRFRRAA